MSSSPSAKTTLRLPPSVTNYGINLVGALAALIALYALHELRSSDSNAILIVCAAGVVPIILLEILVLRVHRRESTGIDWDREPTPDLARVLTKLLGLAVTVGLIALAYYVFPEYNDWYKAFWNVLRRFWLMLLVLPVLYFWFVDGRSEVLTTRTGNWTASSSATRLMPARARSRITSAGGWSRRSIFRCSSSTLTAS